MRPTIVITIVITIAIALSAVTALLGQQATGDRARGANAARSADKNTQKNTQRNTVAADGTTSLHLAVRAGDQVRVQALIAAGADVNAATRYHVTPLSLAAQNGDGAMLQLLIRAGANPNAPLGEGQTVLMTAARTGSVGAVKVLIEAGADVNARERWYQQTAVTWAAAENHAAVVTLLAEHGADLDALSRVIEPPKRGENVGVIGTSPRGGFTPVAFAAREGAIDAVRALADAGADLNAPDPDGIPPLSIALLNGHYDTAMALIEKGADVNKVDRGGRGPLFIAVDMHTLESRFNRPAPVQYDRRGTDPVAVVKALLHRGASVNAQLAQNIIPPKYSASGNPTLTKGATPFLKAATTSDVELMKLLLEYGANPFQMNLNHTNAVMMASGIGWRVVEMAALNRQEEAIEAVKLLLPYGLDINAVNDDGDTALHGAARRTPERDSTKLIQFLVDNGANLNAVNKVGRRPLEEALGGTEEGMNDRRGVNHASAALLRQLMGLPQDAADSARK